MEGVRKIFAMKFLCLRSPLTSVFELVLARLRQGKLTEEVLKF